MSEALKTESKVLHLNVYFLLPPDFNGDLTEAIRELVRYREQEDKPSPIVEQDVHSRTINRLLWNRFLKDLDEGYRLTGASALVKREADGWTNLPVR